MEAIMPLQLVMVLLTVLLGLIVALGWLWLAGPGRPRGRREAPATDRRPARVEGWGSSKDGRARDGRHIR
jgi:hypothetical protein